MELNFNSDDDYELVQEDNIPKEKHKRHKSRKSTGEMSFNKHLATSILFNGKYDVTPILIQFYSILFFQQLFAFASCICGIKIPLGRYLITYHPLSFIINFFICTGLSIFSYFFKWPLRNKPYSHIFLAVFSMSYAQIISYLCLTIEENTIMMAIFTTFVITVVFVIYVSMNKENFNFVSQLFIVIVAGGFHYGFFNIYTTAEHIRVLFSLIWLLFWGFYLTLWTKRITSKIEKFKSYDYILSTFRFYIFIMFLISLIYAMKFNLADLLY